jgi:hypothetical protein
MNTQEKAKPVPIPPVPPYFDAELYRRMHVGEITTVIDNSFPGIQVLLIEPKKQNQ